MSSCKLRCKETCIGAFMSPAAMVVVGMSGCRYTELVYAAGPGHRKRQCARQTQAQPQQTNAGRLQLQVPSPGDLSPAWAMLC